MLAHWDPFSEMSRLHDRVFGRSAALNGDYAWKPAVDIYEDEKLFHVDVEVPGVKPEDINVNVENNVLTITGERKLEAADQRDGYHRVERFYGSFSRSFALTDKVDVESIDARYDAGVLKLSLPKRPEAAKRAITIKH
jgi:HSP20 family protein